MRAHILLGGPTLFITDAKGKEWRFEDHPYCGPSVVDKHDMPLDNQPSEKSPFWTAINLWLAQGKPSKCDNGKTVATWTPPKPVRMKHIGGRHYMLVPDESESSKPAGEV